MRPVWVEQFDLNRVLVGFVFVLTKQVPLEFLILNHFPGICYVLRFAFVLSGLYLSVA
jgi:hypothetical protein